jgi:hypothetical protein
MYHSERVGIRYLVIGLIGAGVLGWQGTATGAVITVTSTAGTTGGPDCTIRDAITAAKNDSATGGCPAGSGVDTVVLQTGATYTLTQVDNVSSGSNGLPTITSDLIIEGVGSVIQRSFAGGTPDFRILYVLGSHQVTLDGITLRNGRASAGQTGGGLRVSGGTGTVTITGCTITGNVAVTGGGGIEVFSGEVVIDNSTISNNSSDVGGGLRALPTVPQSIVTVTDSTFSGNNAAFGGGVNLGGGLTPLSASFVNVTFSGNSASVAGGGLRIDGPTTMGSSTVTANNGGGIRVGTSSLPGAGDLTIQNTIVANQSSGLDCVIAGFDGTLTSAGYNLDSDGSCGLTDLSDLPSTDPQLAPLADNGGPTRTHALPQGSPAVDSGLPAFCPIRDQRAVLRPLYGSCKTDLACDIGAFELDTFNQGPDPALFTIDFDDCPGGSIVTAQYPQATFSSDPGYENQTMAEDNGSSLPNFACAAPSGGSPTCVPPTYVDFTDPVNDLTLLAVGVNDIGVVAQVNVIFDNGLQNHTVNVKGRANVETPILVDLRNYGDVTRIEFVNITDESGIGWDDLGTEGKAIEIVRQYVPALRPPLIGVLALVLMGSAAFVLRWVRGELG